MSVTQRLRDLFWDSETGLTTGDEINKELSVIERKLGLPVTTPNPWGTTPPERVALYEAEQAAEAALEEAEARLTAIQRRLR